MNKHIKVFFSAVLILALSLSLLGCASNKLPKGFDEEEVGSTAEEIVGLATEADFDSVISYLRDDLRSSVTADQLRESWTPIYEKAGTFVSITKTAFSSTTDQTTGDEYAVVQVQVKHLNANLVYTLSFDQDLMLVGLYLK